MMLSYRQYVEEAVYKLIREKAGVFKVMDPKLNETGITLDQNLYFGKDWDIIVEEVSKGSFKTKHDALIFIEQTPQLLGKNYSCLFADTKEDRVKFIDKLWGVVSESIHTNLIATKKSLMEDSPYWKLSLKDGDIVSASIYKDRGSRKLVATICVP
ncbi:hypothetical protein GD1_50 [Paraglaciecola Antarctic GD virus 1]|nr:hypothetical protein GD1_50 [Paraglaciecola Antarctic GD virus 1]